MTNHRQWEQGPTGRITEARASLLSPVPRRLSFRPVSTHGFGDRHNTWAWSMCWWKGNLYVGTNRAFLCTERAAIHAAFPLLAALPFVKYPPEDPDTECTSRPIDLPLQAEIWRWTPETESWERVYQSPQDVPIPGHPGKYVAREIGFRDMAPHIEPDGTEALYVSGVNSQFIYRTMPPPPLLRSIDGHTFEPVPQKPGTCLGELKESTFRTIATYQGRLFIVGSGTVYGDGVLLESDDPAAGNDHFRQVSPPGMRVFEMAPFNGYLYLGLRDPKRGYAVMKTEASGSPPYTYTPVVSDGAFLSPPSQSVISMHVFNGRLYVGTDGPAELIRINPDDTWDLVIGTPRKTPDGWKFPTSGLDAGFHSWLNGHIWRMQVHEGHLYLGTMKMSTHLRNIPGAEAALKPNYGFDLYETTDGQHFAPITVNGFGDKFAFGVRSFASTPYGLFLGTANGWYGLQIWRGTPPESDSVKDATEEKVEIIPLSAPREEQPQNIRAAVYHPGAIRFGLPAPEQLGVESDGHKVVLSWTYPTTVKQFRIWRAEVSDQRRNVEANPFAARLLRIIRALLPLRPDIYMAPLPEKLWIPGTYVEMGVTETLFFVDTTTEAEKRYLYYVQAENRTGYLSSPSNMAAAPPLGPALIFDKMKGRHERP